MVFLPPPPWTFRNARVLYQPTFVPVDAARAVTPVDEELQLLSLFGRTLGGVFVVDWRDSPIGPYRVPPPAAGLLREPPKLDDPEALAPPWLLARWRAAYGADAARRIAAVIAGEPAADLTLRSPELAAELAEALEAEILPGGTLRTARRGDLSAWPGFETGAWWVQDASAAVPARLLEPGPGQRAADLCAAPGGLASK